MTIPEYNKSKPGPSKSSNTTGTGNPECKYCGKNHRGKCFAFNRFCSKCKQKGHYRKWCKNQEICEINESDECGHCGSKELDYELDYYDQHHSSDDDDVNYNKFVWTIINLSVNSIEWLEDISFSGKINLIFKIDTGSNGNTLNISDFKKLENCLKCKLEEPLSHLWSYSGHELDILGQVRLSCEYKKTKLTNEKFFVLRENWQKSSLGLDTARKFGFVMNNESNGNSIDSVTVWPDYNSIPQILDNFKNVFSGIGKVDKTYKITLKDNATPVVSATRKIPIALKNKLKLKLDEMVSQNIIIPVEEPTDWVHPVVIAPKANGDIRVCMDPRSLNKFIRRETFEIPTHESLFSELSGAKCFTLLDASSAFLQIPLDRESSLLCTITTPFGGYRYLRLPYGLSSAPERFQRFMSDTLRRLKGVISYFDDILIFGSTVEEHNKNLYHVLSRKNL